MLVTKDLQIPIINGRCGELLDLPGEFIKSPPRFDELVEYQTRNAKQRSAGEFAGRAGAFIARRAREVRGVRTHDAERNRDRGAQRPSARRQLRPDLHRHHQARGGGGACGAARLAGSADRAAEPARVPRHARPDEPHVGAVDGTPPKLRRDVPRSRPLQGRQRYPRSPHRRHAAPARSPSASKAVLRGNELLARLGGDEFAIVVRNVEFREASSKRSPNGWFRRCWSPTTSAATRSAPASASASRSGRRTARMPTIS